MTPLLIQPERQKNLGAKNIAGLDINLVDYVAFLICHSSPNKDTYSAKAERNYSILELEATAISWSTCKSRFYKKK